MPSATTYSRDEVREIDRRAIEEIGLPGIVLMENAGRGCVELLRDANVNGSVAICCGRGNNGGDGYVIARHLENAGLEVQVLLFADSTAVTGDAATNLRVLRASGTPLCEFQELPEQDDLEDLLQSADWVVDALLGTGTKGEIREPYASVIETINRVRAKVFAVDLPSGLDCDRGVPLGPCVRADLTGTFVGWKRGFENPDAARYTGVVHTVDIGIPRRLLTSPFRTEE
jgi:NAD(P)H-hydrate epimerase